MSVVQIEKRDVGIAIVQIQRPEVKNALNLEVRQLLAQHFAELATDDSVRAVVLTGGSDFAAGADIKDMVDASPVEIRKRATHSYWKTITEFPKPIIAAVNGYALGGGCELAMHADIIIAGESATFGQPEVKLGIMPGAGGTQRLVRTLGKHKAMRYLLTGDFISAQEAEAMGLVSQVVPDSATMETAIQLASKIAKRPAVAVQMIKEAALMGMDESLDVGLEIERKGFQLLFATHDQKEGMSAFLEKRKPEFRGE